jgi:hypothetical protein
VERPGRSVARKRAALELCGELRVVGGACDEPTPWKVPRLSFHRLSALLSSGKWFARLLAAAGLLGPRGAPLRKGRAVSRRLVQIATLAAVTALLSAGTALADAGGQGTVTITQHDHDVLLFSDHVTNPCTGAPGTVTAIATNEVFHITYFTNGDEFWVTGTDEGTANFTPDDPTGVSASGHFATWFGESGNNKNDVQHDTFNLTLANTDGSHVNVHETSHLSTNAAGVVTVSFDKMSLSCTG